MTTHIAQTPYGPIEYRIEGSGPAVMVLNGGHCSRDTRLSHEKLALSGFTVITPSRPGYDATPVQVGQTAQAAADALASLLDVLNTAHVAVIGISAAGPTALAFAQQHPHRTTHLILESAISCPWDTVIKRYARYVFGPTERQTWTILKLFLRLMPTMTIRMMMREFTTLKVRDVMPQMQNEDLRFIYKMLASMRSGKGFLSDIEHHVEQLQSIQAPVLVIYSPYDRSVPPYHAQRVAYEVAQCERYEVQAHSHLIWIGPYARQVWEKRLAFLSKSEQ